MSKKGLVTSLVLGLLVTLSLGIYTIVSVLVPGKTNKPVVTNYTHSYRYSETNPEQSDTGIDIFSKYGENVNLSFEVGEDSQMPIEYNEETKLYDTVAVGEVTVTAVLDDKGNKDVHHVIVYAQGDGLSEEAPWILAQPQHVVEFADAFNNSLTAEAPAYVKLVDDVVLTDAWTPIGNHAHPYDGNFDGNGKTISRLRISLNVQNYQDYLCASEDLSGGGLKAFLDLGFFGETRGATIKNLSVTDAEITINSAVYDEIANLDNYPDEMLQCTAFGRLSAGTLVGYAEDTTIVGGEEARSVISSTITGFSYTNSNYAQGLGGVAGVARRTQISNYQVSAKITDLNSNVKNVRIGGVVGSIDSNLKNTADEYVEETAKSVIDNVEVDNLHVDVYYSVNGEVGGIAGRAISTDIKDSAVMGFVVADPTGRSAVDYSIRNVTMAAGIAARIYSSIDSTNGSLTAAFISSVQNVTVTGVDIHMLGGNVGGAFGVIGDYSHAVADTTKVVNTTVSGTIYANIAAGFARQVNAGVTVSYDHEVDGNVVDIRLRGQMLAGFVSINYGTIKGYVSESENPVKTSVKVIATGTGVEVARPQSPSPVNLYNLRNATYVAGLVSIMEQHQDATSIIPSISNIAVNVSATNSINYAGVAQQIDNAKISNVDVVAAFTSATVDRSNYKYSPTYMVSGVANLVGAGTTIENCNVKVDVNKNVNVNNPYSAAYVGGLVARYTGDVSDKGLTLTGNTLTGSMYFNNFWDQNKVTFDGVDYPIFVAGGLVGSMSNPYSSSFERPTWWDDATYGTFDPKYYDAIVPVNYSASVITNNNIGVLVEGEVLVEPSPEEAADPNYEPQYETVVVERIPFSIFVDVNLKDPQGQYGYLTRALGATIGALYTRTRDTLDLSSNKINRLEVEVYEQTFTYSKANQGSQTINRLSVVNSDDKRTYGVSYLINSVDTEKNDITDISDVFEDAEVPAAERKIVLNIHEYYA